MKLLVTGATGFIGSHLTQRLEKDGHDLCVIIRPSSTSTPAKTFTFDGNIPALITFMQEEKFDGVIHLASLFLAQHTSEDIPGLINSNILFSTALLEATAKSETPWFINTGTFWQHFENADYAPVNLYAATKQAFQDIAQYYLETTPLNFVTLQLSDTFGPGDLRPKVFNLWMKIAKSGETLEMSPGEQLLDISFIENVIDGYVQLIKLLSEKQAAALRGKSFALSSGKPLSLKKLAEIFATVTGATLHIAWGKKPYRPREVMIPWNLGEKIPGLTPRYSLEEGIKLTFNEK